jgi:hypothetical protein
MQARLRWFSKGCFYGSRNFGIVLSPNGKQKTQRIDSKLFVSTWIVNKETETIIITGHNDTNNNGKHDKTDNFFYT